jgi:hypothetical protein
MAYRLWAYLAPKMWGRNGICGHSGLHHIVLSSTDKNTGALWTKQAQKYPLVSEFLGHLLRDSAGHWACANLSRFASLLRPWASIMELRLEADVLAGLCVFCVVAVSTVSPAAFFSEMQLAWPTA